MSPRAAIILAAGQGTRMKSTLPKVLHPLAGRTLLDYAIDAATAAGCERIVVVTGLHSPDVGAHVAQRLGAAAVAIQDSPLGTAHAVLAAKDALDGFAGDVVISYADCPLVGGATLQAAFEIVARGADVAVLGFEAQDPGAYGRLVTDGDSLSEIVEAKEASPEQLAIRLCNSGIMAAHAQTLFSLLPQVKANNAKGEYYLTDVVGLARGAGLSVKYAQVAETDVQGVNSQAELAAAESVYQQALRLKFLNNGVRMLAPETVIFSHDTFIGAGSLIEPYVVFGPGVSIAAGATVRSFSHLEGATVDSEAVIGPYARLRPGAEIGAGAHIGNFVEVKNVALGAGAKANHLSYLGDGAVGPRTNIGAGVIFCNYDGYDKHRTIIGSDAFIGSNAALVAPVAIGDGALIGSGSVIVSDVPADALALARGRQYVKDGWAADFRAKHKE